jgi:hypothetical protein
MKVDVKKLLLDSIDLEKLAFGLIDDVIEVALKEAVAKSATPIDDSVVAILYPIIEVEVKKLVSAKIAELKAV